MILLRPFPAMRSQWCRFSLVPALALTFLATLPTATSAELSPLGSVVSRGAPALDITIRDDDHDHHNPHAAPLLVLNETQVTLRASFNRFLSFDF